MCGKTNRQTDKQTDKQTNRQTFEARLSGENKPLGLASPGHAAIKLDNIFNKKKWVKYQIKKNVRLPLVFLRNALKWDAIG